MIHQRIARRIVRKTRQIKQRFEAGRREMKIDDVLAYRADTMTSAHLSRMLRYSVRLHRISHGHPPFQAAHTDLPGA